MPPQPTLQSHGHTLLPTIFTPDQLAPLIPLADDALRHSPARAGARIPTSAPLIQHILAHAPFADAIASRGRYRPVRAIVFDKSPAHNWGVPWHRDTTIAVREKHPTPGFGPWSVKDNTHHVQPPPGVLRAMLTIRLHLDPAPATNGALRCIPGSHLDLGDHWPETDPGHQNRDPITLEANPGDLLLMNPLTLHASSKSTAPAHRRVVHIEFADRPLRSPSNGTVSHNTAFLANQSEFILHSLKLNTIDWNNHVKYATISLCPRTPLNPISSPPSVTASAIWA